MIQLLGYFCTLFGASPGFRDQFGFPETDFSHLIGETVVVATTANTNLVLTSDGNSCRIRDILKFNPTHPKYGICKFTPREYGYSIDFENSSLFVSDSEDSVVAKTYQPGDAGFIFNLDMKGGQFIIKSGKKCLQMMGVSQSPEGWYVNAKPCSGESAQTFFILSSAMYQNAPVYPPPAWSNMIPETMPAFRKSSFSSASSFRSF